MNYDDDFVTILNENFSQNDFEFIDVFDADRLQNMFQQTEALIPETENNKESNKLNINKRVRSLSDVDDTTEYTDSNRDSSSSSLDSYEDKKQKVNETNMDLPAVPSQRKQNWLAIPHILQQSINSGDLSTIRTVVNDRCLPDFAFVTSESSKELRGRSGYVDFYQALLSMVPDSVLVIKNVRIIGENVLLFDWFFNGTLQFRHPMEEMICDLSSEQAMTDPSKRKIVRFLSHGLAPLVTAKGITHMTFSPDQPYISQIIYKWKVTEVTKSSLMK